MKKHKVLAIRYKGPLKICSVGNHGIFERGVAYRLTAEGFAPPPGHPRVTEADANELVEGHGVRYSDFVRDQAGEVLHELDGRPKVQERVDGPFEIVAIDKEGDS